MDLGKKIVVFVWRNLKRGLPPAFALMLLTSLGVILDLTYQGKLNSGCFIVMLNLVRQFLKSCGLSHAELWNFITNSIGVLITLVTLVLTFTIEIFERSEKKIFGISQKELINIRSVWWYRLLHKMTLMLPIFMLVYFILGFCAGSYLLLFLGYLFLVCIYCIQRRFYDEEKMCEKVCQKLLETFQGVMSIEDVEVENWDKYKSLLIDIYDFTQKESDWIRAQGLFFKFIKAIKELEDDICFVAEYYFALIVLSQEKKAHEFDSFRIIKSYMEGIEYNERFDYKDQKDSLLLWGLLLASLPYSEERELIDFLGFFTDFTNRSCNRIRYGKQEIPDLILKKESAMVLVLLEEWLKKYTPSDDEFERLVEKVYKKGRIAFDKEDPFNQEELIFLCESIPGYSRELRKNVNDFRKERRFKIAVTRVASIAGIYEK